MELLENNPAEIVVEAAAPEEADNDLSAQEDSEEDAAPADAGDERPVSPPPPADGVAESQPQTNAPATDDAEAQ